MEKKSVLIIVTVIIIAGAGITGGIVASIVLNPTETTFIDDQGRSVVVPTNPQRIISMSPSITEYLFALEVEDRLVGVTDYCNYPPEAQEIQSIGGFSTPNIEVITSLDPDLIISSNYNAEGVELLENVGFALVVVLASSIDDIIDNVDVIGGLVNARAKAVELKSQMTAKLNEVTQSLSSLQESAKVTCYFEVWESPMVAGESSFIDDMITKAGGINIFGDLEQEWPIVSHEAVISVNPEAIFITEHSAPWYTTTVCERTGYNTIDACKHNRIYTVNDDKFLRPGPRIVDALEEMASYLYPTLFS